MITGNVISLTGDIDAMINSDVFCRDMRVIAAGTSQAERIWRILRNDWSEPLGCMTRNIFYFSMKLKDVSTSIQLKCYSIGLIQITHFMMNHGNRQGVFQDSECILTRRFRDLRICFRYCQHRIDRRMC